jgi:hypothetical protein
MSPPRLERVVDPSRARIDDTVRGEPQAIAARATANPFDTHQSRDLSGIDPQSYANRNLTKLAPLRFMIHWM